MRVACDVVFQLKYVMSNQSALLCSTLPTLSSAHINVSAGKNFCITDIFSNEDLFIIIFPHVVEANEAEFFPEDIRKNLGESELFVR